MKGKRLFTFRTVLHLKISYVGNTSSFIQYSNTHACVIALLESWRVLADKFSVSFIKKIVDENKMYTLSSSFEILPDLTISISKA